jgi:hypothetical protein
MLLSVVIWPPADRKYPCGLLPKFALNMSFREIEEGFDHYAARLGPYLGALWVQLPEILEKTFFSTRKFAILLTCPY